MPGFATIVVLQPKKVAGMNICAELLFHLVVAANTDGGMLWTLSPPHFCCHPTTDASSLTLQAPVELQRD